MAGSVKNPLLQHRSPTFVRLNSAGVPDPARRFAMADGGPEIRCKLRLSKDLIPVDGVDGRVAVTMEYDDRHTSPGCAVPT
jgi:hypothetical protein